MDHKSELIQLTQFVALPAGSTHSTGIKTTLHIPNAILGLRHKVGTLAAKKNNIEQFHIQERGLYEPLEEVLLALLPRGVTVDHEAVLKKLSNSMLKTDLSIRKMECYPNLRLADHDFVAIIEMKSVFFGEKVSEVDLLADLEKLLECETAYSAKCFFVLVGLKDDLTKAARSLQKFLLHNTTGPISIELPSKKTAWLQPSARYVVESPYIYVWTVSNNEIFGARASDYTYTVFEAT